MSDEFVFIDPADNEVKQGPGIPSSTLTLAIVTAAGLRDTRFYPLVITSKKEAERIELERRKG